MDYRSLAILCVMDWSTCVVEPEHSERRVTRLRQDLMCDWWLFDPLYKAHWFQDRIKFDEDRYVLPNNRVNTIRVLCTKNKLFTQLKLGATMYALRYVRDGRNRLGSAWRYWRWPPIWVLYMIKAYLSIIILLNIWPEELRCYGHSSLPSAGLIH